MRFVPSKLEDTCTREMLVYDQNRHAGREIRIGEAAYERVGVRMPRDCRLGTKAPLEPL